MFERLLRALAPGTNDWYPRPDTPRWLRAEIGDRLALNGIEEVPLGASAAEVLSLDASLPRLVGPHFVRLEDVRAGYEGALRIFNQAIARVTVEDTGETGFIHASYLRPVVPAGTELLCDGDRRRPVASTTVFVYPDASSASVDYDVAFPTVIRLPVPVRFRVLSYVAGARILHYEVEVLDGERAGTIVYTSEVNDYCVLATPPYARIFLRSEAPRI